MDNIDVVVVSYRTEEEVERLEKDLATMTGYPYKLYVFDNTGNPKTLSIAWNDLAVQGMGNYVAFLNPDIIISPNWGRRMVEYLDRNKSIGAIVPIAFGTGRPIRTFFGPVIEGTWGDPPSPDEMNEIAEKFGTIEGHYIYCATDCCAFFAVLMKRKTWSDLKGFDERFTLYGQDHDFQDRLRERELLTAAIHSVPFWNGMSVSTKRACEHREISLQEEYVRLGQVLEPLRAGRLARWHRLTDQERAAVRANPRYNKIAR